MSDTLLQTTMRAVVDRIAGRLPAAYGLDAGEMQVGGEAADHAMPADGTAVRWPLGEEDGFLVVAVTADAADFLREGPPETSLVDALTLRVESAAVDLAAAFDGIPPMLGEGEEVPLDEALASGPGDPVSIALDDAGTHRATIGLRLVVSDALMAPAPDDTVEEGAGAAAAADQAPAGGAAAEAAGVSGGGVPLEGPDGVIGAGAVPLTVEEQRAAAAQASGVGNTGIVGSSGGRSRQPGGRSPLASPIGEAHPADFASFDQLTALPGRDHSMALLGDVELGVTAELGRTELTVRDVLGLTPGSIIELDRAAGSPVDVVVNGTLIARGEVVVIDEEFGIRITEILGMADEASPFPIAQ